MVELDLSDLHMIPSKAMMALEVYGHIDILINNAGISYRGVAVNTSVEVDQLLMRVNYFGPMSLTKGTSAPMTRVRRIILSVIIISVSNYSNRAVHDGATCWSHYFYKQRARENRNTL